MKQELDITVEGDLSDFLGVNIERRSDGSYNLTQPHLIDQILEDLRLPANSTPKDTPMKSSQVLLKCQDAEAFDRSFHMQSVVGKLNYLEKGLRPDISYATHQIARFQADPRKPHGDAVRWLGRYLLGTRNKGIILKPDGTRSLEVFVDASFAGDWDKSNGHDVSSARSRYGYLQAMRFNHEHRSTGPESVRISPSRNGIYISTNYI